VTAWVGVLLRLVVGSVWVVAGALKLPEPAQSVAAVRAFQLLPSGIVPTVGQLLPVIEVVVGLMLVLGLLTRAAAAASVLLLVAFIVGIASVWARGINIDCGCFGGGGANPDAASEYPWEIARDALLLAASTYLVWRPSTRLSLDSLLFRRTPLPEGS
jgi:uncharacterized membrane protein YphA (DoxX/SURF4 family)